MFKRREFLSSTSLIALTPWLKWQSQESQSTRNMVIHQVLFWLKNKDSEEDKATLKKGLGSLKGIGEVKQLYIGTPAATLKRDVIDDSYSFFMVMFFDDIAGQDAYQVHPLHTSFVEQYNHLWERVVVYDAVCDRV
jgi:hypothetical protein